MKDKVSFTLGIDIGSYSVKCAEVSHEEGRPPKIQQVVRVLIPNASKEGAAEAFRQLFSKRSFSAKKLRVAVSGPALIIRRIQMPRLTYSELKGAMRFEAESHIPFPIDDCLLDFQILDETPDKKKMNVLLVAAKRDLVQQRLQGVAAHGMDLELVDVDVFCVINAFEKLGENSQGERVHGLLNIGHQGSSFAVIQDKLPFYVREIAVGGREVTKALAQMQGIPEPEAEKLKIENAPEVSSAVQKGLEPLMDELRHAVDYFENESGESLRWIGLSGGGATAPVVSSLLSEELGRTVSLWDNSKKLSVSESADRELLAKHSGEFNVALGLALRGVKQGK